VEEGLTLCEGIKYHTFGLGVGILATEEVGNVRFLWKKNASFYVFVFSLKRI